MNIEEVKSIFAKELPTALPLTDREAERFLSVKPFQLMSACRSTAKWIAKRAAGTPPIVVSHSSALKSVQQTLDYRLKTTKPQVTVKPLVDRVEELREFFQATCSSDNAWTITSQEAEGMLKRYGEGKAKKAFAELGRFGEEEQQICLDRLEWLLAEQESGFCVPIGEKR